MTDRFQIAFNFNLRRYNADTMAFPIQSLIHFWVNHHLLNILERPLWRVVKGKAQRPGSCSPLPPPCSATRSLTVCL
jgi:hypothetical protein